MSKTPVDLKKSKLMFKQKIQLAQQHLKSDLPKTKRVISPPMTKISQSPTPIFPMKDKNLYKAGLMSPQVHRVRPEKCLKPTYRLFERTRTFNNELEHLKGRFGHRDKLKEITGKHQKSGLRFKKLRSASRATKEGESSEQKQLYRSKTNTPKPVPKLCLQYSDRCNFQDEFMGNIDLFSDSWRMAIDFQKLK